MSDNEEQQREEGNEQQTFEERLEETQRLTTQWSVEDEEEAARERRRRERQQQQLGSEGQSPEDLTDEAYTPSEEHEGLKPAAPWETEEDEGFSDWSQRLEQRKQRGAAQAAEESEGIRHVSEETGPKEVNNEELEPKAAEEEEDEGTSRYEALEVNEEPESQSYESFKDESQDSSYQWQAREYEDGEENQAPRAGSYEEEAESKEDNYEPVEDQYQVQSDQQTDRWNSEVVERRRPSVNSDGEEGENDITVTERAEILNRSIQKSNSMKRSEPPLPINKIDDFLEQYTHAVETSKPGRLVRQSSLELLSPADAVASKKNRWETGEVVTASKLASCKDTEGINIGVSDIINHWGKGKTEPDGLASPTRVTEVKPGEVLSKKSLWEQGPKSGSANKSGTPSKKYKFVPTGHGKYEKVLVEDP